MRSPNAPSRSHGSSLPLTRQPTKLEVLPELDKANREILKQNINVQLYEILKDSGIDYDTIKIMVRHKNKISDNYKQCQKLLSTEKNKQWRRTHKMMVHKDLGGDYKQKLKGYFNSISSSGKSSNGVGDNQITAAKGIGVEELEDPLITLGICKSREEVKEVLGSFNTQFSGRLNFEEFVNIVNGIKMQKKNRVSSTAILEFFRSTFLIMQI